MNEEKEGLPSCFHHAPFVLGEWTVYPSRNQLRRGEETVSLQPKVMNLLCTLAGAGEETISRDQLIDKVWKGLHVSDAAIDRAVYSLRRTLGDSATAPRYIETVRKKGLRLIINPAEVPSEPKSVEVPVTTTSVPMELNLAGFSLGSLVQMTSWRQAAVMLGTIVCVLTFWSIINNPIVFPASGGLNSAEAPSESPSMKAEEEDCAKQVLLADMSDLNADCTPQSNVMFR